MVKRIKKKEKKILSRGKCSNCKKRSKAYISTDFCSAKCNFEYLRKKNGNGKKVKKASSGRGKKAGT
jgi:hypothetical protein